MDAHDHEYAAAAAGMHSHTIGPVCRLIDGKLAETYAVNDPIKFLRDGETLSGTVVEVLTETVYHVRRHVPDIGYQHYAVDASETVPF